MSKQNNNADPADAEDNLLNALESIKSLLEQSESKLSAARESINRANQPAPTRKKASDKNNEPVVPVLDDIVDPDAYAAPEEQLEIPEITEEAGHADGEPTMNEQRQSDSETMLEFLDHLQASLEKEVRNTLMRTVVNIEKEVKKTIAEQLDTIRNQIRNGND